MAKKEIFVKERMNLECAISYLEDVVKSLREGRICFQKGEDFLSLSPASFVEFEIEGVSKKSEGKINLELSWKHERCEEASPELRISSAEPVEQQLQ